MGLDVDFECEKQSQGRARPKIARPPLRSRSKVEARDIKGEPAGRYFELKNSDGNFRDLPLCSSTSPRRKSMPSRPHKLNVEDNTVLKRGSVYKSSSEVRRTRKTKEGRKKETAYSDEAFLSFEIVDSSSGILRDDAILISEQTQTPADSLNAEMKSPATHSTQPMPTKCMEFLDLSFRDLPEKELRINSDLPCTEEESNLVDKGHIEESILVDEKSPCGRDAIRALPKSFSAKDGMVDLPFKSEREILKASPKVRYSPLKRMFYPIMKSKSLRNPSLVEAETDATAATDPPSTIRNGSLCKSLLSEFSKTAQKMEYCRCSTTRGEVSSTGSSPTHLHAILKLEFNHGAPSFEFSVKDPEDVLSAKTWRTDSAFNWAYTFHSCRRKSYSSVRGTKDRHGQSTPMVGQMQVSCFLCSEANDNGSIENSMVTDFILHDIGQARRSICIEERSRPPAEILVTERSPTEAEKYQHHSRRPSSDCDSDPSTSSYPWSPADLHPHLEIAAITIQIPFKKEVVKDTEMEETCSEELPDLYGGDDNFNCLSPAVVKVVTPSGTHGLPTTEDGTPSSLLEKWRLGGGCDCGGWDMACPIFVLDNPCGSLVDCSITGTGSQQPMLLFFQGRKEKIPALCMTSDGKGQYSVDFHAQLSALQAFSICIAILHSSEASPAVGQEKNKHMLYSNSLKLLIEEEVKHLIEAVAEEKRKSKKKVEQMPPCFVLDPPFSPMGRV